MTSINPTYNINYAHSPVFKAKDENISAPVSNPVPAPNFAFKGTEALRAYNFNLINKNKDFDDLRTIKKLEMPADLTQIGGTPVYNSKGELVLVEKTFGDKKYVYHNDEVKTIEAFDKKGNKINEQTCFNNYFGGKTIVIREFIPDKKDYYSTSYISENGKDFELCDNMKHVFYPDGSEKEFIYEAQEDKYRIIERDNKIFNELYNRTIDYNKNKNVEYITEHTENSYIDKQIKYVNGVAYSINEDRQTTIKNNILENKDFLSDKDLKPHKKFNFHPDAKNVNGEKTFYSNGNVETNTFIQDGKEVRYEFLPNGEIRNVFFDNITIECNGDYGYSIQEHFDKAEKHTIFSKGGYVTVSYNNFDNDIDKRITFIGDKVAEYAYIKDDKDYCYRFDKDGNLKEYYESTITNEPL